VSDLALRQRVLLKTLKGRGFDAGEEAERARLQRASDCVAMLRETMLWWRRLGLSKTCPLSVAVLEQAGLWPQALHDFVRDGRGSAYIGEQADQFLDYLLAYGGLIASAAATERALRRSAADPAHRARIVWPCDPAPLLGHCTHGAPLPAQAAQRRFVVRVGGAGPCSIEWRAERVCRA